MGIEEVQKNRIREIAAEHLVIRETMRRIEQELDRLVDHPAPEGEEWKLPELVRLFRDHLRRHIQLEEQGGLLGEAVQYYDARSQEVAARLVAQHRGFERTIDQIIAEFEKAVDCKVPAPTVQSCYDRDLRKLLTDLSSHEHAENGLLESVVPMLPKREV
jgi:hemerythrin-like domain-containing protein